MDLKTRASKIKFNILRLSKGIILAISSDLKLIVTLRHMILERYNNGTKLQSKLCLLYISLTFVMASDKFFLDFKAMLS